MLTPNDVTAVIVTRGDCDLSSIQDSLIFGHTVVYDNSTYPDLGAYGRYIGSTESGGGVVYFQDDDCLVKPEDQLRLVESYEPGVLSVLMPPERTDYKDTVLIGWGALCDFLLPFLAFKRWVEAGHETVSREFRVVGADFIFPMLTPWKRLDGQHTDLPQAHAPNRTWGSYPNYAGVKERYLREARRLRDERS